MPAPQQPKVTPIQLNIGSFCPVCQTKRQDTPMYWLGTDGRMMFQDCACPPRSVPFTRGASSAS